jgi:hypothetical protein
MQLLKPPGLYVPLRHGWQYAAPCRTPSPARQTAHDTNKDMGVTDGSLSWGAGPLTWMLWLEWET